MNRKGEIEMNKPFQTGDACPSCGSEMAERTGGNHVCVNDLCPRTKEQVKARALEIIEDQSGKYDYHTRTTMHYALDAEVYPLMDYLIRATEGKTLARYIEAPVPDQAK